LTLLQEREEGRSRGEAALHERTRSAVLDIVRKQAEIGLSVINDGEQGRADYTIYVKDRLTGFSGESSPWPSTDAEEFPEWAEMARQFAPPFQKRPACTGPVEWKDWPAVERDIQNLKDATAGRSEEVFMTSPSPGQIGRFYDTLPHIVFDRCTLPWERTIDGTDPTVPPKTDPPVPWLALILLTDADFSFAITR
jgi:5-methyltetrahydropteroyltriglutamate--homocysteine methyltransferase